MRPDISKLPVRQLTELWKHLVYLTISKLPVRQLTTVTVDFDASLFSKLPVRQLTLLALVGGVIPFSKLPVRQLTVFFCANILILSKLASSYSYLTKILYACQKP